MNRKTILGCCLILFCIFFALQAEEDKLITEAKKLFERYVSLEHSFDIKIADIYSDDALIQNKRKYQSGEVKVMTIPAPKYKEILKMAMPIAKTRGDISTYTDVKYSVDGTKVRINATRYSELKKYSSPMSLLVGPNAKGDWLIYEELGESQE